MEDSFPPGAQVAASQTLLRTVPWLYWVLTAASAPSVTVQHQLPTARAYLSGSRAGPDLHSPEKPKPNGAAPHPLPAQTRSSTSANGA